MPKLVEIVRSASLALAVSGCCGVSGAIGSPDPCPPITYRQEDALRELQRVDVFGAYVYPQLQPVLEVIAEFDAHCREDDALMGRGTE